MNQKKVILVAFSVAILVLFSASISFSEPALWPKREGELCWANATGMLHLYVLKMGNSNHYFVNGYNDEGDEKAFVNGFAIVNDDEIEIHVSSSGLSKDIEVVEGEEQTIITELRGQIGTAILNADDLNGSFVGVQVKIEGAGPNGELYEGQDDGIVKFDGTVDLVFDDDCSYESE